MHTIHILGMFVNTISAQTCLLQECKVLACQATVQAAPLRVMDVGLKLLVLDLTTKPKLAVLPPLGCRFCQLPAFTVPLTVVPEKLASQFQACSASAAAHQHGASILLDFVLSRSTHQHLNLWHHAGRGVICKTWFVNACTVQLDFAAFQLIDVPQAGTGHAGRHCKAAQPMMVGSKTGSEEAWGHSRS